MAVKIPILKIEEFLIASIQTALDDRSVIEFQDDLLERISQSNATGVVVDITAVDLVDSFMARSLNDIAIAVHLLGAHMVIVGMQPAVAMTLVAMGLTVPNALMALNLEKGLKLLREKLAEATNHQPDQEHPEDAQEKEPIAGVVEQAS
jgi:rsbT antagonist protein RsbS